MYKCRRGQLALHFDFTESWDGGNQHDQFKVNSPLSVGLKHYWIRAERVLPALVIK